MDFGLELAIRDIVRTELAAMTSVLDIEPELITPEQAAKICGVGKSVIYSLHHDRENNGFPSVMVSPRHLRIDKRRLSLWFNTGGLGVKE